MTSELIVLFGESYFLYQLRKE